MEKGFLILAVILAAVLSSGCVTFEDPAAGVWVTDAPFVHTDGKLYDLKYEFNTPSIGMAHWKEAGTTEYTQKYEFVWLGSDSGYNLFFSADIDGDGASDKQIMTLAGDIMTDGVITLVRE